MSYSVQRVRMIAYLFVVLGIAAWLQTGVAYLAHESLAPGIEMALLPAGIGLLYRSDAWRRLSIGLVVFGILTVVAVPVLGYTVSPTMHVRMHGTELDPTSPAAIAFVLIYGLLLLACLVWVAVALHDESVRKHFADN